MVPYVLFTLGSKHQQVKGKNDALFRRPSNTVPYQAAHLSSPHMGVPIPPWACNLHVHNIGSVQKSSSILWGKWLICVLIIDKQCRDLGIYKLLRKGTHKKENRNRMLEKCKKYWHSLVLVLDQGNEFLIEDAAFTKPSNLQKNKRLLLQVL